MEQIIKRKEELMVTLEWIQNTINFAKQAIEVNKKLGYDYLAVENRLNELREERRVIQEKIYTLDDAFNILNEA